MIWWKRKMATSKTLRVTGWIRYGAAWMRYRTPNRGSWVERSRMRFRLRVCCLAPSNVTQIIWYDMHVRASLDPATLFQSFFFFFHSLIFLFFNNDAGNYYIYIYIFIDTNTSAMTFVNHCMTTGGRDRAAWEGGGLSLSVWRIQQTAVENHLPGRRASSAGVYPAWSWGKRGLGLHIFILYIFELQIEQPWCSKASWGCRG